MFVIYFAIRCVGIALVVCAFYWNNMDCKLALLCSLHLLCYIIGVAGCGALGHVPTHRLRTV